MLSGRGGSRACWCCPKGGPLTRQFCPSGLNGFSGDDKNHLICSECAKALEQAKARQNELPDFAPVCRVNANTLNVFEDWQ